MMEYDSLKKLSGIRSYHSFSIPKSDGDERTITAPDEELKKLQKRILRLLEKIERPEYLISGEKGKSYITNARTHQYSNYFLTIDIRKFYENCRREYVYRFFTEMMETSKDVAHVLTDIITFDGKIPTGCPTSQMLAYYSYVNMFHEISVVSEKYNCLFTLYVDDMTFSSTTSFNPKSLSNEIDIILRKYGHKPKYKKVQYYSKNDYKPVTGVIITEDHKLMVPNRLRQKIYSGAMTEKSFNPVHTTPNAKKHLKNLRSIKGQIQAAKNIEKAIFPEINRLIETKMQNVQE